MLSGRPGTGKTTVILIKLFATFYNYYIKKSIRYEASINWNSIKQIINEEPLKAKLKTAFTSLSDDLCSSIKTMFLDMITKQQLTAFPNLSKNQDAYSFRTIEEYPIFINFRKLMFLIDGSLTFQFFY